MEERVTQTEKSKIEEIKLELSKGAQYWKADEVDSYLSKYNLNSDELFEVINYFADDNYIFRWLEFIGRKIPEIARTANFLSLVKKIILKIKNDLAQGMFTTGLINIGEQDPEFGICLYKQMKEDSDLLPYSSFLLGGAGKKQFDRVFEYVQEDLKSQNPSLNADSIKTLRVAFFGSDKLLKSEEIFKLLDKYSSEQPDSVLTIEAAHAYLEFSRFSYDHCNKRLLCLAKKGNSRLRFMLAETVGIRDYLKDQDAVEILSICGNDEDKNVLSRVVLALARKGPNFPELSLRIIKNWILNGKYSVVHDIDYAIAEIGKRHFEICVAEVVSWIGEKDDKRLLPFLIPEILSLISGKNYLQLLASIRTWWSNDKVFEKTALETMKKVLTNIYPPHKENLVIIDAYYSFLQEISAKKNIDLKPIMEKEPEKLFQCICIIKELENDPKSLDFEIIMKNLEQYPNIREFLGMKWFESMEEKDNKTHPLLLNLSSEINEAKFNETINAFKSENNEFKRSILSLKIRWMITPLAFLRYVDNMLSTIISKAHKVKDLRNGLKNDRQFLDTLSEIEVISSFIENYTVDIGPELNGKKLDLKIGLDPEIYVEVISPDKFKPLKYLNGKVLQIKNRSRGKLLDELRHHFKDVTALRDTPWIIVVDIGRSEISDDFIEDALLGTEQITFFLNKETKEVVGQKVSRKDDAVHDIEKNTDILSMVICYKANLGKDGNFHRVGNIVTNSYAKNPLSEEALERIKELFFK